MTTSETTSFRKVYKVATVGGYDDFTISRILYQTRQEAEQAVARFFDSLDGTPYAKQLTILECYTNE
jgi:hypothetical protein